MNLNTKNWKICNLGDICKFEYGNNLTAKMRNGGQTPVYGSAGIVGWHDSALTKSETLIVGRKGSVGNVFYSSIPCFPIDTTFYVQQIDCNEDLRWLELFLAYYDLSNLNMATAVPGLNRNIAHLIKIPLPPLKEQKRIAALFQSVDEAIAQTEAQEKKLLQTKRKLLNDLFSNNLTFGYLKSNDYETITFEGIAEHISKRIEPGNSKAQIYVGLEHLDPENLRIERTGKPTDVKGIKLKVYKDDIIFGKRRAYLKKVAVSHFDGICSAHSMVLRAVEQNIQKDFLPFFMQSDYFMNRAVQISEGSLSPTIKWKVLAKQEFHLPNKDKQDKLVSLFRQIDNTSFQVRDFQLTLKKLKQKLLDEILG